jgi:hypothetical protein
LKHAAAALIGTTLSASHTGLALSAGDLTQQTPIDIKVQLSDEKNARRFVPDRIELETGKLYRLTRSNPSSEKHYFSSEGLAQAVLTRKLQVNGPSGQPLAEVKGVARAIDIYPHAVGVVGTRQDGTFQRSEMHDPRPCGCRHGRAHPDQVTVAPIAPHFSVWR